MIPLFLYDNADIAADPHAAHLRTAVVKRLSRLEFVRGVKVSAPMKVLGNYARAAGHFHARGAFGIYTGNARLVFEIFDAEKGPFRRHLDRSLLRGSLPVGVVAGQANALPREWQAAWCAAVAGIDAEAARFRDGFARLSEACRPPRAGGRARTIACLKRALARAGVLASDTVAPGTPPIPQEEARAFDAAFAGVRTLISDGAPARRVTPWPSPVTVSPTAPAGTVPV
jgi:dihydrodipicolinate synthase/N-acetylneuraminate lyase